MNTSAQLEKTDVPTAAATGLALAAVALRYPDEAFADAVWSGGFETALNNALQGCGSTHAFSYPVRRQSAAVLLHDLRVQSTNLFYSMPHAKVSPYESVWRAAGEGRRAMLFVDDVALDAKRSYREAGLEPARESEPCDHVATELEFASMLLTRGDMGRASVFAKRHLSWIGSFCSEVAAQAPRSFYAELCVCLPELVKAV